VFLSIDIEWEFIMLSLYHSPRSRSSRFIWLLEELGADYQIVYCSIRRHDGSGASDPANPHPDKSVPALIHDRVLITESAAIALYLTDLMSEMGPAPNAPDRGAYLSWLAYYAGEIEPAFAAKMSGRTEVDAVAAKSFDRVIKRVYSTLKVSKFLLGERFSAADILVASIFQWYRDLAPACVELDNWLASLATRPALMRAIDKDEIVQAT
jgi:glutathione S-transferase